MSTKTRAKPTAGRSSGKRRPAARALPPRPDVKNPDDFLNIEEAAGYLRQTTRWIRRSVAERRIRHTHHGRRLAFQRSWLDEYSESQVVEPEHQP
jgi:excisionase family DNA binding protein